MSVEVFVNNKVVSGHHLEALGEHGKSGAEVHLTFKNVEDILVVVVGVGEQPVEPPHDLKQMLSRGRRNGYARAEIIVVLNKSCSVV